jgi:hypothetical protein
MVKSTLASAVLMAVISCAAMGLEPRRVTLAEDHVSLSAALVRVRAQTRLPIADRRTVRSDPKLKLDLRGATFWQAVDALARKANCNLSLYEQDGIVALVDGPYRAAPLSHDGLFRVAVKHLGLMRDIDTGRRSCQANLELAWEPWFQPFYLEMGPGQAQFSRNRHGAMLKSTFPGQGRVSVTGKSAAGVVLRLEAPDRSAAKIEMLRGTFRVVGPSKMLTFVFSGLKPMSGAVSNDQEGVKVSLTRIELNPDRWSFDILIENPPGGPEFESYQSWLDNNRIYLEKGQGKNRQVIKSNPADEEQLDNITARRARIRYHFPMTNRQAAGPIADWRLVYITPGRIVEVAGTYEFRDIELP